jgi:hypothetical protein
MLDLQINKKLKIIFIILYITNNSEFANDITSKYLNFHKLNHNNREPLASFAHLLIKFTNIVTEQSAITFPTMQTNRIIASENEE